MIKIEGICIDRSTFEFGYDGDTLEEYLKTLNGTTWINFPEKGEAFNVDNVIAFRVREDADE